MTVSVLAKSWPRKINQNGWSYLKTTLPNNDNDKDNDNDSDNDNDTDSVNDNDYDSDNREDIDNGNEKCRVSNTLSLLIPIKLSILQNRQF